MRSDDHVNVLNRVGIGHRTHTHGVVFPTTGQLFLLTLNSHVTFTAPQ